MLKFDYPPPTGPESRHMWMLLNPDHLRTVTDLSDLIRSRYFPNQRGALCLYVHDCLLPPGESARLVRDNDVIRVQWRGYDPEDDDMDSPAHPTKKRSRQRCEEDDAGDRPTITAKKRKCEPQPAETPQDREEMVVLEECEQEESTKSSRRKAKKKKKVLEEGTQEVFPEESSERSKHKKHSKESASLKAVEKILSLLGPNQEPSAKRGKGSSSSHQEPSEVSIQPITTIPLQTPSPMTLRLFAALSVEKKSCANVGYLSKDNPSEMSLEPIITSSGKKPSQKSGKPATPLSAKKPSEMPLKPGNKSNNDPPGRSTDKTSSSDSEPSTDQGSSTKPKKPSKKLHKPRTVVSVNKSKPNHKLLTEGATKRSLGNSSESSSDQESSTKRKEPPKVHNKSGTVVSVKSKPNHELPAKRATISSFSDSSGSSSDHESSTKPKEPPKVLSKDEATVSVHKTNANIDPSTMRTRSSIDFTASSYDQELSTARKNSSEATKNPSDAVSGRTVFSSEMRKSKNNSASDNGDIRKKRSLDISTVPPLNGMSQKPHKETPSSASDPDTNIQEPVTAQYASSVVPPGVTNGGETGGIHQGPDPNPSLYDHGRGRGRGILPWRGQGGRGFRGWGDRGKGRGFGNQFFHSYDSPSLKKQQLEEEATNTSVILQNPPESPKKDYSTFPLLAAPPQVGKVIAFKILELDENYSPELSDYKEGVVRSVDPVTLQVEVELLAKQKRREPGKFDLVYELEDGREIVEFAVRPDRKMKEPWSSLITPRLVMEKGFEKATAPQTL